MTAGVALSAIERDTAASEGAAVHVSAGLIPLSPGIAAVGFRTGAATPEAGLDLRGPSFELDGNPLQSSVSWHQFDMAPEGVLRLLLLRSQKGLEPGGLLGLRARNGSAILHLRGLQDLGELLGGAPPPALALAILRFLAAKGLGVLRAAEDARFAAACHGFAELTLAPDRVALPLARCGHDAILWAAPPGTAAEAAVHYVIGRQRIRRLALATDRFILPDRHLADGFLLPPHAPGPIHLAPAGGPLPRLAELGRRGDAESRNLHRAAQAEIRRRAPAEPYFRQMLRDQALLAPALPFRQVAEPDQPFGGSLDMAVPDPAGGLFLRGWLRDPLGLVAGLTLVGDQEQPLDLRAAQRFPRPDLLKTYAESPHGGAQGKPGFVAYLPAAARRPVAQWSLRLELTTGDSVQLTAPPGLLHPQAAREKVLGAIAPAHVTPEILTQCIAPPVARLHAEIMAGRGQPDSVAIGTAPARPPASFVIPLYRNLRFLRHQYGAFARDPALAEVELIYVLDSPEQRDEVEHLLRGLHGLYGRALTLLIQPVNYGYAAACNAGAEVARAPVLLLFNSDVVPADRGWLGPLLAALEADPGLGAVGPKLLFEDGSLQHAGLFFERGPRGEWFNNHYFKGYPRYWPAAQLSREVPGVTGAAFCARAEAYRAVGGLTLDYVIGDYEDSDLCLKLRQAGWRIAYVPGSELYHFERQSIREHVGYARTLAGNYNRLLHHGRWDSAIAALMARMPRPASAFGMG
ncbi:glycosyltransferase [Siccirubricoccus phaeus]|uniref:glycosyltransferase n=1 Tax=Siccirubricoccus phaeus TaxID=2595053 RepID=UPI0011F0FC13|nr:glycosyltransferase [Siccirubricoccus phaeus]